jgi:hypothetical protein
MRPSGIAHFPSWLRKKFPGSEPPIRSLIGRIVAAIREHKDIDQYCYLAPPEPWSYHLHRFGQEEDR